MAEEENVTQVEDKGPAATPDVASEIAELKAELAARIKVQETLESQLKGAKSQEDFDKLSTDYAAQLEDLNRQLMHSSVMGRFGLDEELAEFVFGDTEQEMIARAEKLKQRMTAGNASTTNRSGGGAGGAKVGGHDPLPNDPGKLADLFPRNGLIG